MRIASFWPWRRYQLKIALFYLLLITVMLGTLNIYPVIVSQNIIFNAKRRDLIDHANQLSASLSGLDVLDAPRVGWAMQSLDLAGVYRAVVTDAAGLIVYDNSKVDSGENQYLLLPEIVQALGGYDIFTGRYRDGRFISQAVTPVLLYGQVAGAVYLHEEDVEQGALLAGLQMNLAYISLVLFALVLLLSVAVSTLLARRLGRLARSLRKVREGEYGYHARVRGHDELAQVESDFNDLSDRLLQNERQRRQFVSDASHELKTPLASMRLLADSILQNEGIDTAQTREFVADMGDEIDRLARLTDKLLRLTRLDDDKFRMQNAVDFGAVAARAVKMLTPLANNVGVTLHTRCESGVLIAAEEDDCYQIIYNLLENAMKYNHSGGFVETTLRADGHNAVLTIKDSGVGIPEAERELIFDRFYRVDKARARQAGGVGLGLAIVGTAVRRHGGTVSVDGAVGEGSIFTVTFKLYDQQVKRARE